MTQKVLGPYALIFVAFQGLASVTYKSDTCSLFSACAETPSQVLKSHSSSSVPIFVENIAHREY